MQNAPFFTKLFGEFVTFQWADRVVGPYRVSANPYYPANFERKAFLPQSRKGNYYQIWRTVTGGAYQNTRKVTWCARND